MHEARRRERYIPTELCRRKLEQTNLLEDVVVKGKYDNTIMNL